MALADVTQPESLKDAFKGADVPFPLPPRNAHDVRLLPGGEMNMFCHFPLLVLKGIDFSTGHMFSFLPGDQNANGGLPPLFAGSRSGRMSCFPIPLQGVVGFWGLVVSTSPEVRQRSQADEPGVGAMVNFLKRLTRWHCHETRFHADKP